MNAYLGLEGYIHDRQGHRRKPEEEPLLPRVHRVVSLLKRWLMGTHQGAIGHDHLDYYLGEFTFRFNRRKSASRGKLFYRLTQQAVQVAPAPFATLVKPQPIGEVESSKYPYSVEAGGKGMSREELLAVLDRAARDISYYSLLAKDPDQAVRDYELTEDERAALASIDVRWIETHIGSKLDERFMTDVIVPLLSREKW